MKISQREKTLLLVLLIAALGYLGYTFGYSAYVNYKDGLQAEYDTLKTQYEAVSTAIQMKPVYERDLTATKESIQKLSYGYMDKIEQEKIIAYFKSVFDNAELTIKSANFKEIEAQTETGNAVVERMDYFVEYEGNYSNLKAALSELQESQTNVIISGIETKVTQDKNLSGSFILTSYAVDNEYTRANVTMWDDLVDAGSTDPFYYEGTVVNTEATNRKYDFLMTVKPIVSDYPTVIIQAVKDTAGVTNINADSNTVEDMRVYFKSENGQYMYRYETANSSYPLNNEWAVVELANDGYINVRIMSTERNTTDDTAGVRLIIDNQSGIGVNVYVTGDDATRPRVSVDNTAGVRVYNE